MGTNYFTQYDVCEKCGRGNTIHIGKSSHGWKFALHKIQDFGLNLDCWKAWKAFLKDRNAIIENEYGDIVSFDWFVDLVETSTKKNELYGEPPNFYLDNDGYRMSGNEFC